MITTINKKRIGVWLPNKLFKTLKQEIKVHNESTKGSKIDLAKSAYIMNLLFYIPQSRDEKYLDGWVPICSETLNKIKGYKNYINFLQEKGFLDEKIIEYSTASKECRKYKLGYSYRTHLLDFHWLEDNSHFIKKNNKLKIDRMEIADIKCVHLTKWLNPEFLTVDITSSERYINETYNESNQVYERSTRLFTIKSIQNKCWSYSRDGLDNRLHSILTKIPKDLRRFVKYNQEELISLDIKSSQPFIYASILNQVINPSINRLNNYLSSNYNILHTTIMSDLFRKKLNYSEIQEFINQVIDSTFYEVYGDYLYKEGLISLDVNGNSYVITPKEVKGTWVRNFEKYDNLREAGKNVFIQSIYSSEHCHSIFNKAFMNRYPEVFEITQFIKANRDKNFFPILLQNIEANCVLDYCTKHISMEYPEMPLFTIHDSIVTTIPHKEILEHEFPRLLNKYFALSPSLQPEKWSDFFNKAS